MRWISKDPPIYVWEGDEWYNERDGKIYIPMIEGKFWLNMNIDKNSANFIIPFPKKTKVLS